MEKGDSQLTSPSWEEMYLCRGVEEEKVWYISSATILRKDVSFKVWGGLTMKHVLKCLDERMKSRSEGQAIRRMPEITGAWDEEQAAESPSPAVQKV